MCSPSRPFSPASTCAPRRRRDVGRTLNRHTLEELRGLAPEPRPARLPRGRRCGRGGHGQRPEPRVPGGSARHRRGHRRHHVARLPLIPGREHHGRCTAGGHRRRGIRLLRPARAWPAGAEGALQARDRGVGRRHGRGRWASASWPRPSRPRPRSGPWPWSTASSTRCGCRSRRRSWMADETRAQGIVKLDALRVKIGYPDRWRDWSGLGIGRTSYAANRLNAARFELDRQLGQLARAGRSDGVGDAPARGQRLLPPDAQRDRLPGRHPAGADVRRRGRRRRQLRRHRHRDRP